jgi:hypothetical protein
MDSETYKEFESVERRISRLEAVVETIANNQARIEQTLSSLSSELRTAIGALGGKISDSKSTDWRTLASWASIILGIVALGISSFVRDQSRMDSKLEILNRDFVEYRLSDQERTLNRARSETNALEQVLLREIALQRDITDARMDNVISLVANIEKILLERQHESTR